MARFTGTLKNGFQYDVDSDVLTGMRFLDALADTDENPLLFNKAVRMLLGSDQREELYKHIEENGGTASMEVIADIITEIVESYPQGKN